MDNETAAKLLRQMKNNIFATAPSIEEILELTLNPIAVMMAVNTTLELAAEVFDDRATETAFDIKAELAEAALHDGGE